MSPSAASNPAETEFRDGHFSEVMKIWDNIRAGLTDDEVGIKLVCYWHDDPLECINVIGITETWSRPRDIDRPNPD